VILMPSKPFRPGYEASASQLFTFAGVKYARGDRFPYRDLGIIDFDLRGLWFAERIEFGDKPYEPSESELEKLTAPARPSNAPPAKQPAARR